MELWFLRVAPGIWCAGYAVVGGTRAILTRASRCSLRVRGKRDGGFGLIFLSPAAWLYLFFRLHSWGSYRLLAQQSRLATSKLAALVSSEGLAAVLRVSAGRSCLSVPCWFYRNKMGS